MSNGNPAPQPAPPPSSGYVRLDAARFLLLAIWLTSTVLPFILFLGQTTFGFYKEEDVSAAWSWFIPNIGPTLLLMIGVVASSALVPSDQPKERRLVSKPFFWIALALSVFYLLVFLAVIISNWIQKDSTHIGFLTKSNYPLGFLQSLSAGAIGILFTSQLNVPPATPKP